MNERRGHRRGVLLLTLAALAGAGPPLAAALLGSDNLLVFAFKDDGFYYLTLARQIAHGHGATFDGLGPTNGFHPLWTLLLAPLFWLPFDSAYDAARAVLVLATAIHVAAGLTVARAARALVGESAGFWAGALYLVNPLALYLVVSGMESPLVVLLVALLAEASIRLQRGDLDLGRSSVALRLGVLGGLAILARTDLVLLTGLVVLAALLRTPERADEAAATGRTRELFPRLRGGVIATMVAAAVVAPWILWNLVRFGSLVQVSARAHQLHAISVRGIGDAEGLGAHLALAQGLLQGFTRSVAARTGAGPWTGLAVAAALGLILAWLFAVLADPDARRRLVRGLSRGVAPLLYAVGFLGATFFLLGHIRSWYVAGPLTVGSILLAIPIDLALSSRPLRFRGRTSSAILSLCIAAGLLLLGPVFAREILGNARSMEHCWREAADWVAENIPEGERVASFNSGTFGYLSPRAVVNLDCVVNNRALPFLERKRLLEFLERDRIVAVVDDPGFVARYLRAYAEDPDRLVPVDTLRSGLVAYRLTPAR